MEKYEGMLASFKGVIEIVAEKSDVDEFWAVRETRNIKMKEEINQDTLNHFIKMHGVPIFNYISPQNYAQLVQSETPVLILFGDTEKIDAQVKEFLDIAMSMKYPW